VFCCLYKIERGFKKSLEQILLETKYYEKKGTPLPYPSKILEKAIRWFKGQFHEYDFKESPYRIFKANSFYLEDLKRKENLIEKTKRVLVVELMKLKSLNFLEFYK